MKQKFKNIAFKEQSLRLLAIINNILNEYKEQNLDLSLRQLYYQLISTAYDKLPDEWRDPKSKSKNNEKSYKKVGDLTNNGRLAGLLDWNMLKDRGRNPNRLPMWDDPVDRLRYAAITHRLDKWEDQPRLVWVMIEKEALEGVMIPICRQLEVPCIANKGYSSASSMYEIGREFYYAREKRGKKIHVLYLGDHDPSGLDMTNDIKTRLEQFSEGRVNVHRLALNWDQIETYGPPPNPAKQTDSRYKKYTEEWGEECYELDALTPSVITSLIQETVNELRDDKIWKASLEKEKDQKDKLARLAERVNEKKVKLI